MERMDTLGCKRRRLDNNGGGVGVGGGGGIKISIMSGCDKFAPMSRLPQDVLREDVLSRLPVRDLCRANCVCKEWRSFICSPDFIKVHRRLNHEPSHGLLIATTDSASDEFVFYYSPLSEQHHRHQPRAFVPRLRVPPNRDYQWMTQVVNGLVCLYSVNRLSLHNVCTGEILDLPLPPSPSRDELCAAVVDTWCPDTDAAVEKDNNLRIPSAGEATNCTLTRYYFGFDTLHKVYKILSVSYMCREGCPCPGDVCWCQPFLVPQVLSLSGPVSSFKWRNEVPHPRPFNPPNMHTICVKGVLWWKGNEISRICFDLTATPEQFRIITNHPPVSDTPWFFTSIPSQYGGCIVLSEACLRRGRSLRLFTRSTQHIYCQWTKCDINLPLKSLRRGRSSIALVGNLPDGDIFIASDEADESFTPVYSFTPGRINRFSKSFKVGKLPPAAASMSPRELAVAITCVEDNLTPICNHFGNCSHL